MSNRVLFRGRISTAAAERIADRYRGLIASRPQGDKGATCLVQLGRYGDVINILPVAKALADRSGQPAPMVTQVIFCDVLEGASYVRPVPWTGHFHDVTGATEWAAQNFGTVLCSQINPNAAIAARCESFAVEAWRLAGFESAWGKLPLLFDRRDPVREARLATPFLGSGKPILLLCTAGHSSPLPKAGTIARLIRDRWEPHFHIAEIGGLKAEKFHDLLGLMDRAAGMICIDSGPLHLAAASRVPVIAFTADSPTLWHGTKLRCNAVLEVRYGQVLQRMADVHAAIQRLARPALATRAKPVDAAKARGPVLVGGTHRDKVVRFYRTQAPVRRIALPDLTGFSLTNVCLGVGDTVMLTDLPRAGAAAESMVRVHSPSPHFDTLMRFNPYFVSGHEARLIDSPTLLGKYDCGNGHTFQRLQRAFGLPVALKPQGCLAVPGIQRLRSRVILHFEAGAHAAWQRENLHPRARQLYAENKLALEQFIRERPSMEFIEVGSRPLGIKGAQSQCGLALDRTVELIASAQWFIGIMSGPMHVATALGVRCVVCVNFPDPSMIYLPTLVDTGLVESEWFYPQNVHLHQDGEGGQVKRFALANLHRAFAGEVYPFWTEDYLDLIHEKL